MNLTKFSIPCSHFRITIFEQEEEKRGIPLYQTWHIVNNITLYHITSHSILSYQMVSHSIKLSYHLYTTELYTRNTFRDFRFQNGGKFTRPRAKRTYSFTVFSMPAFEMESVCGSKNFQRFNSCCL